LTLIGESKEILALENSVEEFYWIFKLFIELFNLFNFFL